MIHHLYHRKPHGMVWTWPRDSNSIPATRAWQWDGHVIKKSFYYKSVGLSTGFHTPFPSFFWASPCHAVSTLLFCLLLRLFQEWVSHPHQKTNSKSGTGSCCDLSLQLRGSSGFPMLPHLEHEGCLCPASSHLSSFTGSPESCVAVNEAFIL